MPGLFQRVIGSLFPSGRKSDPAYPSYVQFLGIGAPIYTSKNYAALAKEGYERNVTVYRAVSLIAQSCAGIPWKLYQKGSKLREIENHPLLDLLHNPNPRHSQSGFVEEVISFWLLAGNSYVTVVRPSVRAKPSELWALRPDRMRVVPGVTDIAGYQYEANGQLSFFQANDILHLRMFSATDDWYGLSPLLVAGALIDQQNEGADWNTAILQNSGRPSGALIAAGALGNDQYDRLRKVIRERYTGKRNAGTPMLLEGGLDWKPFSMTPLELDWGTSRTLNARDIAIALGVPPELLGDSSNKTYNNYAESRKSFYQETVLPLMDRFRDRLNVWLTDSWSTDLYLDYDKEDIEALQEERDKLSARMIAQWSAGITTMNEARKAVGLEEVTGGDIYQLPIASSIYVPDSSLVELVETKLENLLAPPPPIPGAPAPPIQAPDSDTGPQDTGTQQSAEAGATTSAQSQQKPAASAPAKKPKLTVVKSAHASEIKAVHALYKDLEEQAMGDLVAYFAKEQQRVVEAAKGAVVSATIEARIGHELDRCIPLLEETLLGIYERSSAKSAEMTAQSLAPGKAIGIFSNGEHFFKKLAKKIAALIHGTTREEIGHAVAYGAVKGESVQQIANRIGSIYDTEVKTTRAQRIAVTEANAAANYGAMQAAKDVSDSSGFSLQKQWVTMGDAHVRKAHSEAEGEIVDLDAPFVVGGEELLYPGDSSLGASAGNTVFCRCKLVYTLGEAKSIMIDGVRIVKPSSGGGGDGSSHAKPVLTAEQIKNAHLEVFGGGDEGHNNEAYTATIGGQKYFIKSTADAPFSAIAEPLAYQIGETLGSADHLVPTSLVEVSGRKLLVSPWTSGTIFAQTTPVVLAKAASNLSVGQFTKLNVSQYVIGNNDLHDGNAMYDASKHSITLIDMGTAFSKYNRYSPKLSAVNIARASGKNSSVYDLTLEPATLHSIVAKGPAVIQQAKSAGLDSVRVAAMSQRIENVRQLAQQHNPTVGMLEYINISNKQERRAYEDPNKLRA